MNNEFLSARQTLLNILDEAIDRTSLEPMCTVEDRYDHMNKLCDLQSARGVVLGLIVLADIV